MDLERLQALHLVGSSSLRTKTATEEGEGGTRGGGGEGGERWKERGGVGEGEDVSSREFMRLKERGLERERAMEVEGAKEREREGEREKGRLTDLLQNVTDELGIVRDEIVRVRAALGLLVLENEELRCRAVCVAVCVAVGVAACVAVCVAVRVAVCVAVCDELCGALRVAVCVAV